MLDILYENIGQKLKSWAKWIFIIEAITAIISGIVLLFVEYFFLVGLLTIFIGPIAAWVSSWLLYAFGELVEKTCENERNTSEMLKFIKENPINVIQRTENFTPVSNDKIICSQCKCEQPSDRTRCWNCGTTFATETPKKTPLKAPHDTPDATEAKPQKAETATFTTTDDNTIICSQCKCEQPSNRTRCWKCGSTFTDQ